jgi:hypothetical protein
MTFGYNADAAFGHSTAEIVDYAKSLLASLVDKIRGVGATHCSNGEVMKILMLSWEIQRSPIFIATLLWEWW